MDGLFVGTVTGSRLLSRWPGRPRRVVAIPFIAVGCLAGDPLGMTYGVDACDMQKASDVSPSMVATNFGCALPDVKAGSVVAIRFDNVGTLVDEAVVGPLDIQDQVEVEMAEMAETGMVAEDWMHHGFRSIALPPGERHTS